MKFKELNIYDEFEFELEFHFEKVYERQTTQYKGVKLDYETMAVKPYSEPTKWRAEIIGPDLEVTLLEPTSDAAIKQENEDWKKAKLNLVKGRYLN